MPPKPVAYLRGEVGLLHTSRLKALVDEMQFNGWDIEILLGDGWASKRFSIKGSNEAIKKVREILELNGFGEKPHDDSAG